MERELNFINVAQNWKLIKIQMRFRTRELCLVSALALVPCTSQTIALITYSTSSDQEKVFFANPLNYLDIFYDQMALCWIWDLIPPFLLHSAREALKLFALTAFWLHQCTLPYSAFLSLSAICIAATGSACPVHLQGLLFIKLVLRCLYVWCMTAPHNHSHMFF